MPSYYVADGAENAVGFVFDADRNAGIIRSGSSASGVNH